jgi:hypothetical protein
MGGNMDIEVVFDGAVEPDALAFDDGVMDSWWLPALTRVRRSPVLRPYESYLIERWPGAKRHRWVAQAPESDILASCE